MADLFLRGRGADIGVRAPGWMVRLTGAAVGIAVYVLADALGLWETLGVAAWYGQLLLLVAGAWVAPSRAGSLLWVLLGGLTLLLCVVSYTPIAGPMARTFLRSDAPSAQPIDAVAVLSGGMTEEGRVSGAALDRLLTGVAEAKSRHIPSLLLSVIEREQSSGSVVTSEADQRALVSMMAPELDLRLVHDVHSTHDEALAFAALARTHGWTRVLLVTSPTHTRRACAAVEATGLAVQCMPSRPRDYALTRLRGPRARQLAFADALYETAATMLYEVRGWMK